MIPEGIDAYWKAYQATLPEAERFDEPYLVDQFGDNPMLADRLGRLVLEGFKTTTCSALAEWEAEGNDPPTVGSKTIVVSGSGHPLCIIETTEVTLQRFDQVGAEFAAAEAEADRSLDAWRQEHWSYFSRVLPAIGKEPVADMVVVCERFQVIYR